MSAPPRRSARHPSSSEEGSSLNNSPPDSGGVAPWAPGWLSAVGRFSAACKAPPFRQPHERPSVVRKPRHGPRHPQGLRDTSGSVARGSREIVLCESAIDAMSCFQIPSAADLHLHLWRSRRSPLARRPACPRLRRSSAASMPTAPATPRPPACLPSIRRPPLAAARPRLERRAHFQSLAALSFERHISSDCRAPRYERMGRFAASTAGVIYLIAKVACEVGERDRRTVILRRIELLVSPWVRRWSLQAATCDGHTATSPSMALAGMLQKARNCRRSRS